MKKQHLGKQVKQGWGAWMQSMSLHTLLLGSLFVGGMVQAKSAQAVEEALASDHSPAKYCPTEKYDAVTVQGVYLGWQLPHTPDGTITVRLRDSHVPLHIIASETRARSLFGRKYNSFVEVTYDFIQIYSKEAQMCLRHYVLKAGKIIDQPKDTKFYH